MNDLAITSNSNGKLQEQIILYEESFQSRLYKNKSASKIITNLDNSSFEELDNVGFKKEIKDFTTNLETYNEKDKPADLEENNFRKTFGSSKRVSFNLNSNQIIEKEKASKQTNKKVPLFRKLESKSKSMKVFSRFIDDKSNKSPFSKVELNKTISYKYNSNKIKNKNLSFQKNENSLNRISSCKGFGVKFTKITKSKSLQTFSSNVQKITQGGNSKIKNPFSTKTDNMPVKFANYNTNQSNSFVNHIKKKLKNLLDKDYDNRLEKFSSDLKNLDEKKDIIFKEKSQDIFKFIQGLYEEKFKIILEIHKKFEDDLNKLESLLEPGDMQNISSKIYHSVYEDKQVELRRIELEYTQKISKGVEEIEKNYDKISSNLSLKKTNTSPA